MATEFYLCFSFGGVDFQLQTEPYESPEARLEEARRLWRREEEDFDPDEDNLFWLDIENGKPLMGSFTNSDFELDEDEADMIQSEG